jgi:hypothetical protein
MRPPSPPHTPRTRVHVPVSREWVWTETNTGLKFALFGAFSLNDRGGYVHLLVEYCVYTPVSSAILTFSYLFYSPTCSYGMLQVPTDPIRLLKITIIMLFELSTGYQSLF